MVLNADAGLKLSGYSLAFRISLLKLGFSCCYGRVYRRRDGLGKIRLLLTDRPRLMRELVLATISEQSDSDGIARSDET